MAKYILITGGELFNKGAQAMTYITADAMAKKYPDCEIVVFSAKDAKRPYEEQKNYKFKFLPFPAPGVMEPGGKFVVMAKNLLRRKPLKSNLENQKQYLEIFKNAVAMLDISGYALSSDFSLASIKGYLSRIKLARKFNIPVYLLSQSFGPFNFGKNSDAIHNKIARELSYAKCIMARENEGKEFLEKDYGLKNVVKTPDLVLQNKGVDLKNVFFNIPEFETADIKQGSVAIIPNAKNSKFGNKSEIFELYKKIIDILIKEDKNVYFVYHSVEDFDICKEIKEKYYADSEAVTVIERELSCIEYGSTVKKFDFIVASRYHSVVHAYKEGVPAVILGWAVKYRELSDMLSQKQFCFNVKETLNHGEIIDAVKYMLDNSISESKKIEQEIKEIQKDNLYDLI